MLLPAKLASFHDWSRPFRERFGAVAGTRISLATRRAIWASQPGKFVRVAIPGWKYPFYLRSGTSDAAVFWQVFLDRQGSFPVEGTPKFIVDAGANIGLVSICLANRFPGCRILALEIDAGNYQLLVRNAQPYPNIIPLRLGLWSHSTNLTIDNPTAESWSFRAREVPYGTPESISAIGIPELLREQKWGYIDVLKIDVEGAEYEIFSKELDEWIARVGTLVIETHDQVKPGVTALITSALQAEGFSARRFGEYWIFSK